ncbi:MAG TPA: M48 family metallopeptidase [Rhodospirillaceae bacterium]|nr:M48 family metallopeptidase [Rhodospirillaceae bacterium]
MNALPDIAGIPLILRRSRKAKAVSLRLDPISGQALLVIPAHLPVKTALAFAQEKAQWLIERQAKLAPAISLKDGAILPFRGVDYRLSHQPEAKRGVWPGDGVIHVSGKAEHFTRRLTDWLKAQAKAQIEEEARALALILGVSLGRITVRDTKSRWGSCSRRGDLSFSWRLVLAPPFVLSYLVAHELAHRLEMNHGSAFWQLVNRLTPDAVRARHWLKGHGAGLHRIG